MHLPFEEQVIYFITGSYVPWLPEGWPALVMCAWFFYMFLNEDKKVKKYRAEYDAQVRKIARMELEEQNRRRRQR